MIEFISTSYLRKTLLPLIIDVIKSGVNDINNSEIDLELRQLCHKTFLQMFENSTMFRFEIQKHIHDYISILLEVRTTS